MLFLPLLSLAAEPEVSVSLDRPSCVLGESVMLTVTVRGLELPEPPELPTFVDFDVRYRGARRQAVSSYTLIVQGRQVEQKNSGGGIEYQYELRPKRAGLLLLPSFALTLGGRVFMTNPSRIEVKPERSTVFLGEKVTVTFRWFFRADIAGFNLTVPWLEGAKGFLVSDPELDPNRRYQRLIVNVDKPVAAEKTTEFVRGEQYAVITFRKIITPLEPGPLVLEPAFLRCDIVTGYATPEGQKGSFFDSFFGNDFDSFFGMGRQALTKPFQASSEPLTLNVLPVPEAGKPADYTGAVGRFDFEVKVSPERVKTGEPVTVTLKVSGSGNLDKVQLPPFPELSGLKGYEPETKTRFARGDSRLLGEKTFEKVLVPRREGVYEIPALSFSYFDPETKSYRSLKRGPFRLVVEQGATPQEALPLLTSFVDRPKEELSTLSRDVRYIKSEFGDSESSRRPIYEKPVAWVVLFGAPLLLAVCFLVWNARRLRFLTDISFARSKRAFDCIRPMLGEAEGALKKGEARSFYDQCSKALHQFLADKLTRPAGSISAETAGELKQRGLSSEDERELRALFERFESALFASAHGEEKTLKEDWARFSQMLKKIERVLR